MPIVPERAFAALAVECITRTKAADSAAYRKLPRCRNLIRCRAWRDGTVRLVA
jgi:hypothetical protein